MVSLLCNLESLNRSPDFASQVIMFVLLCGYPPFFGDSDQEVLSKAWSDMVFWSEDAF